MNNNPTQSSLLNSQLWLITGGCGFLGTSLIKRLLQEGVSRIRILDNLSVGTRDDLATVCNFTEIEAISLPTQHSSTDTKSSPIVELIIGDIRDPETCAQCCEKVDTIVHFAANTGVPVSVEHPRLDMECNVNGTFNMLEAARQKEVKRFVFASSGAPAGEVEPPIHEELPAHPVSPYGASKLAGEGYCSAYFRSFNIETVALRFGNVYGPASGHKTSIVAKFVRQAIAGEPLEIYGDGSQTRDFIYVDDLIESVILAGTKPGIGGEVFQIASNHETTVGEITEQLIAILESEGQKNIKVIHSATRLGDVKRNFSDTSKAKTMLGWIPQVERSEGLKRTIQWFLQAVG
jgi:UDP-glucose 4-epimerase